MIIAGEIWVNDVKIIGWEKTGNALIIVLEDYLFKQEVSQQIGVDGGTVLPRVMGEVPAQRNSKQTEKSQQEDSSHSSPLADSDLFSHEVVDYQYRDVGEAVSDSDIGQHFYFGDYFDDYQEKEDEPGRGGENCSVVRNDHNPSVFKTITVCTQSVEDEAHTVRRLSDQPVTLMEELANRVSSTVVL